MSLYIAVAYNFLRLRVIEASEASGIQQCRIHFSNSFTDFSADAAKRVVVNACWPPSNGPCYDDSILVSGELEVYIAASSLVSGSAKHSDNTKRRS